MLVSGGIVNSHSNGSVNADDGHLFGHHRLHAAAGVEHLDAAIVVTGQDGHRLGKRSDPLREPRLLIGPLGDPALLRFPGFAAAGAAPGLKRAARVPYPLDERNERVTQQVHVRMRPPRQPAKSELLEAPLLEVLGGQPHHGGVVRAHKRDGKVGNHAPQVHAGDAAGQHGIRHPLVADAGQDPLGLRFVQPRRGRLAQGVRFEVDCPPPVLIVVARHAAD